MANKTKRLTESAMLLALAIVLELVSKMLIPELPFGGQITLVSMLRGVLFAYRHGTKWGLVAAFTYALLEMVLGAKTVAAAFQPGYFGDGTMLGKAVVMCLLDYVLAFTLLGLGGIFRNRIKNGGLARCAAAWWLCLPGIWPTLRPATSCSPAGRSGSLPRMDSLAGAQSWWRD